MWTVSEERRFQNADMVRIHSHYDELLFHDVPILFSGRNVYDERVVGSFVEHLSESDVFLYSIVDEKNYSRFENQLISYRDLLERARFLFKVNFLDGGTYEPFIINYADIPPEYLPEEDAMCPVPEIKKSSIAIETRLRPDGSVLICFLPILLALCLVGIIIALTRLEVACCMIKSEIAFEEVLFPTETLVRKVGKNEKQPLTLFNSLQSFSREVRGISEAQAIDSYHGTAFHSRSRKHQKAENGSYIELQRGWGFGRTQLSENFIEGENADNKENDQERQKRIQKVVQLMTFWWIAMLLILAGIGLCMHRIIIYHVETVAVHETFEGETIWNGEVEVFDVPEFPNADRVFAWEFDDNGEQQVTVAQIPPATTPENAVKAYIVSQYGKH